MSEYARVCVSVCEVCVFVCVPLYSNNVESAKGSHKSRRQRPLVEKKKKDAIRVRYSEQQVTRPIQ